MRFDNGLAIRNLQGMAVAIAMPVMSSLRSDFANECIGTFFDVGFARVIVPTLIFFNLKVRQM